METIMNKRYIISLLAVIFLGISNTEAQEKVYGTANAFPQNAKFNTFDKERPTLLDVVFNGDGTAQDVSGWSYSGYTHQDVTTHGKPTTFWNKNLGRFGMKNGCDWEQNNIPNFYKWVYNANEWTRLENGFSVEAFVRIPETLGTLGDNEKQAKIIGATQGGGFALMVRNGKIQFCVRRNGTYIWATPDDNHMVSPNQYYHIVATFGGNQKDWYAMQLWINGERVYCSTETVTSSSGTMDKPSNENAQCVIIGGDPNNNANQADQGFPGEIYLARIYKDNIGSGEVPQLYNNIKWKTSALTADMCDVVYDGKGYAYDVSPRGIEVQAMKKISTAVNGSLMQKIDGEPKNETASVTGGVWKTEFNPSYGRFVLNSNDVSNMLNPTQYKNVTWGGHPQHFYIIDYKDDKTFKRQQLNGFTMEIVANTDYDTNITASTQNGFTGNQQEGKWFASTETGGTAMLAGSMKDAGLPGSEGDDRNINFIVYTTGKDHYIGTDIIATDPMGDFGSHYAAEIGREQGNTMTQTITELPRGWYRVSCQGFVTGNGSANLIAGTQKKALPNVDANVFSSYKTQQENTIVEHETNIDNYQRYNDNVAAATLFDANPTQYQNEVWVYVNDGTLTIGLEKVDDTGRAFVDNFRLVYGGDVTEIYLSATKNAQETRDKAAYTDPMRFTLRRAFSKDTWNALSLPVSISADQLKANFQADGTTMKLYKLEGIDANRKTLIRFRKVDLDAAGSEGLKANECYVIWPTKIAPTYDASKPYTYTYPEVTNNVYTSSTVTTFDPLYHFENVTAPGYDATYEQNYTTASGTLRYTAYYDKPKNGVSGKFYMVEDGVMYYATKCDWLYASYWILEDVDNVNKSKDFTMLFDDETTGIGSVEGINPGERRVYNLNGQMMGTDNTNTLRKGVYIVNGKKVVIR